MRKSEEQAVLQLLKAIHRDPSRRPGRIGIERSAKEAEWIVQEMRGVIGHLVKKARSFEPELLEEMLGPLPSLPEDM